MLGVPLKSNNKMKLTKYSWWRTRRSQRATSLKRKLWGTTTCSGLTYASTTLSAN